MKNFGGDRRQSERREGQQRASEDRRLLDARRLLSQRQAERPEEDERKEDERRAVQRRQDQRRTDQRREFFRVNYPPTDSPKVLDTNYRILDISCKGIKFYCDEENGDCKPPVRISQPLELRIQFRDEEIIEIQGRIIRCYPDQEINAKVYCAALTEGPSAKRINDEQMYLLKHFPDFYREQDSLQ